MAHVGPRCPARAQIWQLRADVAKSLLTTRPTLARDRAKSVARAEIELNRV